METSRLSAKSVVSLVKGEDRKENIRKALELIRQDINTGNKTIVIKPNLVSCKTQLAATHVDQLGGIMDFFKGKKVVIAEAAPEVTAEEGKQATEQGYRNFGYYRLRDEHDVEFLDLNSMGYENFCIIDSKMHPVRIKLSSFLLDKNNYIISAAKLKTHDSVVATLSIKNLAMGAIVTAKDKWKMHAGIKQINLNLFLLAQRLMPDLAVIDGFDGMEGDGPILGTAVQSRLAIAGTDAMAADRVGVEVMGIDSGKIGYLNYCSYAGLGNYDIKNIAILGTKIKDCIKRYKLHSNVAEQYGWIS